MNNLGTLIKDYNKSYYFDNTLTDAETTSLFRYSFTDDLANLELLHVPLTQAIPTTPP